MNTTDSQRRRVYMAEQAFRETDYTYEFPSLRALATFKQEVLADPWFRERFPITSGSGITVTEKRGNASGLIASASYGPRQIKFPRLTGVSAWSYRPEVALHEIAHFCILDQKTRPVAAHGPEFVSVMLDLVGAYVGSREAEALRHSYRLKGVRIGSYVAFLPPAMREQMAASRSSGAKR